MHWVSKVVGATVGAAERIADIQHKWHIAEKTTINRAGFKQVFNLQHVNEEEGLVVPRHDA